MQKKIFVQKNVRSGGGSRSYAKLLLWAAVSLMVLVLIAPLFSRRGKESREAVKKPDSERGIVVKEIPRSLELLQPDGGGQKQETAKDVTGTGNTPSPTTQVPPVTPTPAPAATAPSHPTVPGAVPPAAPPSAGQNTEKAQNWVEMPKPPPVESTVAKEPVPGSIVPDQPPLAKKQEASPPKDKTPVSVAKKPTVPPVPSAGELKNKQAVVPPEASKKMVKTTAPPAPASPTDDTAAPAKPSPAREEGGAYAVQVGSFKEKQNAEEMQQNLQKRGYQVQMKPATHPKLGTIYVVQLAPVTDVSKASTLVEQIKHEEKVKPMIIRVPLSP
jgi:cell division septation protein DedD